MPMVANVTTDDAGRTTSGAGPARRPDILGGP